MPVLAGIYYFDGREVTREDTASALSLCGAPTPGRVSATSGPGIVLAQCNPTGDGNRAQVGRLCGNVCLWDGRLDNRGDLAAGMGSRRPGNLIDSQVALSLYAAEGWAGFRSLIGDWSLVLWDSNQRSLYLASDYAGIRPLYYHQTPERLAWCSSLSRLVAYARAGEDLDPEYVIEFIARGTAARSTPYRGILAVPAAHVLEVSGGAVRSHRFWSIPLSETIRYRQDNEYEEQLNQHFQSAVKTRLDPDGPTCAELSGGLDSTSIVAKAHSLLPAGHGGPRLVAFTYDEAGSADAEFVAAVERAVACPTTHIELDQAAAVSADDWGSAEPSYWRSRTEKVAGRMRELGSKVLLTGRMGDLVMGNWFDGTEQILDAFTRGKWGTALAQTLAWSRCQREPVYSILREAFQAARLPGLGHSAALGAGSAHDSFTAQLREHALALEHRRTVQRDWRAIPPGRRGRVRAVDEVLSGRALQCPEGLREFHCTHPYSFRPLVEYMLTIPSELVYRANEPRRLMRRAFGGFVPQAVLRRRSKASYAMTFRRSMLPLAKQLLSQSSLRLAEQGHIDGDGIRQRLRRYVEALPCNEAQLRQIILLESWLRNRGTCAKGA